MLIYLLWDVTDHPLSLLDTQAREKEKELHTCPTLQRVQEIGDLYREAIEKYSSVSNDEKQVSY